MQTSLLRPVAVKFFDNRFTRGESNRRRFEREAPLLARVQHPCVPYVITTGVVPTNEGSVPFTVMQYVSGPSLQRRLESGEPMGLSSALQVMRHLLSALDCVHQHDVVHRDVKPDNIMLSEHGTYLIDFSIGVSLKRDPRLLRATTIGERVGTAEYAAPEQVMDSSAVTAAVDIYSAGVVLAEMLGARPRIALDRLDAELSSVPSSVRDVLRRAMADEPGARYGRAGEFLSALEGALPIPGSERPNTGVLDDGLSDDDALVLGVVASLCPMPGDSTLFRSIEEKLQGTLSRFTASVANRRLARKGLVTVGLETDYNGNEFHAIRPSESGELWVEKHQRRVSSLLEMLQPPPSRYGRGMDVPF